MYSDGGFFFEIVQKCYLAGPTEHIVESNSSSNWRKVWDTTKPFSSPVALSCPANQQGRSNAERREVSRG